MIHPEATNLLVKLEERRLTIWHALSRRILTDEEMADLATFGTSINIEQMTSYSPAQKAAELNSALLMQQLLQMRANEK